MFDKWKGKILINGKEQGKMPTGSVTIRLLPEGYVEPTESESVHSVFHDKNPEFVDDNEYVVTVKSYMTQKSTEDFTFMKNFNNDNPMPLLTMVGSKEKETPKMFYMKLHGDIVEKTTTHCIKCGKLLENPISQYFGIGPVCGGHNYTSPFDSEEELNKAVSEYREKLRQITWEGWIPKSAILSERRVY